MKDFQSFCQKYGIVRARKEYDKYGRHFVSYGWIYTSPFYYSQLKETPHFYRLVEYRKMIDRVYSDKERLKAIKAQNYDKLSNWKARFGQIPLSGEEGETVAR